MTLHKLRHSHASHTLAAKGHPVQERRAVTLDVFSHLMPKVQGEAAAAVGGALCAAINRAQR
jgi:hypothetical protein